MSSYVVRLERLRAELRDILLGKGYTSVEIPENTPLATLIDKVDGIGIYDVLAQACSNQDFIINDTEGKITDLSNFGIWYQNTYVKKIILPSVTIIPSYCFRGLTNCTEITLPNVQTIYNHAFPSCPSLTSFTFPSTISYVDSYDMFTNCTNLRTVRIEKSSVLSLNNNGFSGTPFTNGVGGTLEVPQSLVSSYESDSWWGDNSKYPNLTITGYSEL